MIAQPAHARRATASRRPLARPPELPLLYTSGGDPAHILRIILAQPVYKQNWTGSDGHTVGRTGAIRCSLGGL